MAIYISWLSSLSSIRDQIDEYWIEFWSIFGQS